MDTERTCKDRVQAEYEDQTENIRQLWAAYTSGNEEGVEDLGTLDEYGLCFDYVTPYTWKDQPEGYFRYQLSTGGPGDEYRFYANGSGYKWAVYRIEYWFLDWFDGAHVRLVGEDYKLLEELFQMYYVDSGTVDQTYTEAMEDWEPDPDDDYEDEDY